MRTPVFAAGHSLGAAEAVDYVYDRVCRDLPVDGVYLIGSPQPGDAKIGTALSAVPIWRSVQNRVGPHFPDYDLITSVPFDAGPRLAYCQPAPFELIAEPAEPDDPWGLFRYHHSQLYLAGVRKLAPTGSGAAVELVEAVEAIQDLYGGPGYAAHDKAPPVGRWDVRNFIDGQYWGVRRTSAGAWLLVFRGSTTRLDWWHDLEFEQTDLHGARVSKGFWAGPAASLPVLDAVLASA